ncbi:DUF3422 domain-containing protein [Planktotalea sp.]|uniref:DUF3422 family protein n=1 Tax=Planktotalea sp. TaxID=2029877 RepID=UPI0025E85DA0|nr:DUF3422 domain-containing protein [Planktotalea sp.]
MPTISDHPLRYALTNELHARPFPSVAAPSHAVYLAMKRKEGAAGSDRAAEWDHLLDLLNRFGAQHPQPDATHYSGQIGRFTLKWESHTEFVTYTIFTEGAVDHPFAADAFAVFPEDWLAAAPGQRVSSAIIQIEQTAEEADMLDKASKWFVPESIAISRVLDGALVVAADFRIDSAGHMRFAVFARDEVGTRRIGRVIQRLCEIETYKSMAMLGLMRAREMSSELALIDTKLTSLLSDMAGTASDPASVLSQLLEVSAQVENMSVQSAYRFAATGAYEKIVNQRIEVLREERFLGRQTFGEFMVRRFDPSMRTVNATERRLQVMSDRALRAGELLRTKVDVERSAQNQALLTSMDKRAELQLRLQKTVEGLSIVAVSYYAVNIVLYLLGPLEKTLAISKTILAAGVTPLVLICVWLLLRNLKKKIG